MAEHTNPSPVTPSGEATIPTNDVVPSSAPMISGAPPGDLTAAGDAQEAIQQLDRLTDIESGLAEAAQEVIADTVDENQHKHMQHAQELEAKMENQVEKVTPPQDAPIPIIPDSEQPTTAQIANNEGRGYASSEDAEGEIDLDLGGMDDDEYDPDSYGQGAKYDVAVPPNQNEDAYNESATKDEAMPLSMSEEKVAAETPAVISDTAAHHSTPVVIDVAAEITPGVEDTKPVSIHRRPGHQRQSPSYTMEPPAANTVRSIPAPPSFLPARPVTAEPPAPVRQSINQIDLSTITFPEGLTAHSPSVERHPSWVRAWKRGEPCRKPRRDRIFTNDVSISRGFPSNSSRSPARTFQTCSRRRTCGRCQGVVQRVVERKSDSGMLACTRSEAI